jgi:hypothetical protein
MTSRIALKAGTGTSNEAMGAAAPRTMDVPTAGRVYFGLSRNGSYQAAARGQIPAIRVGRLLRVPIAAMERKLEQAE